MLKRNKIYFIAINREGRIFEVKVCPSLKRKEGKIMVNCCSICGIEMSCGFSYQEDICWDCFCERLEALQEWLAHHSSEIPEEYALKDMLSFLSTLAGERYVKGLGDVQ